MARAIRMTRTEKREQAENKQMRTFRRISFVLIALVLIFLMAKLFSFFTDTVKIDVTGDTGLVNIQTKQRFPEVDDPSDPNYRQTYKGVAEEEINDRFVSFISTGNTQIYLRTFFKVIVEAKIDNKWVVIPVPSKDITLEVEDNYNMWVHVDKDNNQVSTYNQGDYFYYKEILEPSEETKELEIRIVDFKVPEDYRNIEARCTIKTFSEGVQVNNDLWKMVFGIDNLPLGVETP